MPRIRVELGDVYCGNTEDVMGADELYLLGAVGPLPRPGMSNPENKGIRTKPISINDRQTKILGNNLAGGIVYDADLPDQAILQITLVAYDEDMASDWSKHGETVKEIGAGVTAGMSAIPALSSLAWIPGSIVALAGVGMGMDKDDLLGKHQRTFQVGTLVEGASMQYFPFSKSDWLGWSSWSYTVRYRVIKGQEIPAITWGPTGSGGGGGGGGGRPPIHQV